LLALASFAVVLADARPATLLAVTCSFGCCARRCLTRRIACTGFFGGCAR
jgi:hypothetical protein